MTPVLQLVPALRAGGSLGPSTWTERLYHDFLVDGESLHAMCRARGFDVIGCLGWGVETFHSQARARLLGEAPADFADGRTSLLICPECGDLGCGAVSVRIRREGDAMRWDQFGWQNDYEDEWHAIENLGPIIFDAAQYCAVIRSADLLAQGDALE